MYVCVCMCMCGPGQAGPGGRPGLGSDLVFKVVMVDVVFKVFMVVVTWL